MECAQGRERPPRPPPPNASSGQRTTTLDAYKQVKILHDEAYKYIEDGLSLDERGHLEQAVNCYMKGLREIEKALNISSDSENISSEQKESIRKIHSKMTKSKLQIESRLENLTAPSSGGLVNGSHFQGACAMDFSEEQPPSYEQAMSSTQSSSFMDLGDRIFSEDSASANSELTANATEIYSIPEGVQVFFITPEGYVSAPSYPSALRVYKFEEESEDNNNQPRPPAFLQVGDWYYPLVPGVSPALHASYGAYIFPDMGNPYAGSSVGLIIPPEVSPEERQNFEGLMTSLTALQEQHQPISASDIGETEAEAAHEVTEAGEKGRVQEQDRVASKIGRGILVAAEWVSWGVNKGAEKAGEMIRRGSTQLQSKINPEDKPREIPEKYQKGVEKVRKATHAAVTVSSYVVSKLGQATAALGRKMAPHVRKQGERFLPRSLSQKKEDGHSTFDDIAEVAASGLHGFGTVYIGLETAAKSLARSLANETVQVVNHKYGAEAAKFADNTIYSTGNLAMTGYNVNHLGVKAIAKRAAKDTGKAVLMDYKEKKDAGKAKPEEPSSDKPGTSGKQNSNPTSGKKM